MKNIIHLQSEIWVFGAERQNQRLIDAFHQLVTIHHCFLSHNHPHVFSPESIHLIFPHMAACENESWII